MPTCDSRGGIPWTRPALSWPCAYRGPHFLLLKFLVPAAARRRAASAALSSDSPLDRPLIFRRLNYLIERTVVHIESWAIENPSSVKAWNDDAVPENDYLPLDHAAPSSQVYCEKRIFYVVIVGGQQFVLTRSCFGKGFSGLLSWVHAGDSVGFLVYVLEVVSFRSLGVVLDGFGRKSPLGSPNSLVFRVRASTSRE